LPVSPWRCASLIAHSYFQRRIEMLAVEMESIAASLLAKLYQPQ
jgi:hypothetical protein